jgi:modulator of FtsH protease
MPELRAQDGRMAGVRDRIEVIEEAPGATQQRVVLQSLERLSDPRPWLVVGHRGETVACRRRAPDAIDHHGRKDAYTSRRTTGNREPQLAKESHVSSYDLESDVPKQPEVVSEDVRRAVFGRTMGLVAGTVGACAIGAWAGQDLSFGWAIAFYIAGFAALIGLNFTRGKSPNLAVTLLFAMGALLGLGIGPTINAYVEAFGASLVAQAAGATALFIGGFGAWGYATRRDLAPLARIAFWALLALIVFGIVSIFISIPSGQLIWCIAGLAIFAVFTMYDFQRLKSAHPDDAVYLAASIFLDVLNVFLFMLQLLGMSRD